ncbi:MAG TPA: DNA polymerase III subunit delta' [Clostridia bacterium]|nr:DNA polymerase III subunit delta' [Clostridia bacterium]
MFLREAGGHKKVVDSFRSALVKGRVAHAYIFSGPKGAGKRAMAGGLAACLLCRDRKDGCACGVCKDCVQYGSGNHPDLLEISPLGASVKIEQIRDMQKYVGYRAYQGSFQICIIDAADTMTLQAANCLLKTLEEPPGKVVFILVTANPSALLPTVLSRCQQVQFQREKPTDTNEYLQEAWESLKIMRAAGTLEAVELAEKYAKLNRDDICKYLEVTALLVRDILVWKETGNIGLIVNTDLLEELKEMGRLYSVVCLVKLMEEIEETTRQIEKRAYARLALEVLFLRLISLFSLGHS